MRNLKRSEEIVLLILTAILIGLFYYQFVYKGLQNARVQYDTSVLETQLQALQVKKATMQQMEQAIETGKEGSGEVATYNNQKNELNALNTIFADAVRESLSVSFSEPTATSGDTTVRRDVSISFQASSYAKAREMINALYHCEYRCLIRDVNLSPVSGSGSSTDATLSNSSVKADLTVTFYETTYNADSTAGINFESAAVEETTEE